MRRSCVSGIFLVTLAPAALLAAFATPAAAAELELTPTLAYRSDDYGCNGPDVIILESLIFPPPPCSFVRAESEDGLAVGAVIGIGIGHGWQVEVLASRQETELDVRFDPALEPLWSDLGLVFEPADADFTVTHLQVGLARTWGAGTVRPFAGVAAGVSRVDADDPQFLVEFEEDAPSASLGAGAKVFLDERIGLRLEGRGYWIDLPSEVGGDFTQTEGSLGLVLRF